MKRLWWRITAHIRNLVDALMDGTRRRWYDDGYADGMNDGFHIRDEDDAIDRDEAQALHAETRANLDDLMDEVAYLNARLRDAQVTVDALRRENRDLVRANDAVGV